MNLCITTKWFYSLMDETGAQVNPDGINESDMIQSAKRNPLTQNLFSDDELYNREALGDGAHEEEMK